MTKVNNRGFTIIELLIATVVFSVILLIITGAIVQFGRIYNRGNVDSKTKEAARNIVNSISQDIQFGASNSFTPATHTTGTIYTLSTSSHCYVYRLNQQVSTGNPGMMMTDGSSCPVPPAFSSTGQEMLGDKMQLADLSVTDYDSSQNLVKISVRVVYGDNEDFTDGTKKACKPIRVGGQFCSVAEMSAIVAKRIR